MTTRASLSLSEDIGESKFKPVSVPWTYKIFFGDWVLNCLLTVIYLYNLSVVCCGLPWPEAWHHTTVLQTLSHGPFQKASYFSSPAAPSVSCIPLYTSLCTSLHSFHLCLSGSSLNWKSQQVSFCCSYSGFKSLWVPMVSYSLELYWKN